MLSTIILLHPMTVSTPGETLELKTPNDKDYNHGWIHSHDKTGLKFSVQASSDAHIMLAAVPGNDVNDTYEVNIGGWGNRRLVDFLANVLLFCLTQGNH